MSQEKRPYRRYQGDVHALAARVKADIQPTLDMLAPVDGPMDGDPVLRCDACGAAPAMWSFRFEQILCQNCLLARLQRLDGMKRPSWDDYFAQQAALVATRATCPRLHVGCVLVRDHRLLATGYNGSLPGAEHCEDVGCDIEDGHCVRTLHAEANAVTQAALVGTALAGAVAYTTHQPCWPCSKLLIAAGVCKIRFSSSYRYDVRTELAWLAAGGDDAYQLLETASCDPGSTSS